MYYYCMYENMPVLRLHTTKYLAWLYSYMHFNNKKIIMKLKPFSYCKETFRAKCSLCIYIHSFSFSTTHVDWQLQWADIHFKYRIQYNYILSMKWKVIDKFHRKNIIKRWNILLQFKTRIPKHKVQKSFILQVEETIIGNNEMLKVLHVIASNLKP